MPLIRVIALNKLNSSPASRLLSMQKCRWFHIIDFCSGERRQSFIKVSDIYRSKEVGKEVTVKGWVRSMRNMKKTLFLDVNDGSTFHLLQVVIRKNIFTKNITYGGSIVVSGKLNLTPSGQTELQAESIQTIGTCSVSDGYPFSEGVKYSPEEQRGSLHFRPRTRTSGSFLRIRSQVSQCIHNFFEYEKFVNIHTPIITSNDCEGAGELFKVIPNSKQLIDTMKRENKNEDEAYFDTTTYLSVSGQLHLEVMARSLCNVYQFGPTFRAENNKSRFHLTEFYMIEAEIAFLYSLEELTVFIEKFIKQVITNVLNTQEEEITYYRKILELPKFNSENILNKPYSIMNYCEAYELLKVNSDKLKHPLHDSKHLTKDHEIFLLNYTGNTPIFLINWPQDKKPFYVKSTDVPSEVAAVDLLFPEVGELCGGSLREDNYQALEAKLIKLELLESMKWYLDLRKHGNVPTAGFGMGFERFLKAILGTNSVKDTIPFPRWPHNCQL